MTWDPGVRVESSVVSYFSFLLGELGAFLFLTGWTVLTLEFSFLLTVIFEQSVLALRVHSLD